MEHRELLTQGPEAHGSFGRNCVCAMFSTFVVHAVTMEGEQTVFIAFPYKRCEVSMINLVDLAGSEKASQSGATGDRCAREFKLETNACYATK